MIAVTMRSLQESIKSGVNLGIMLCSQILLICLRLFHQWSLFQNEDNVVEHFATLTAEICELTIRICQAEELFQINHRVFLGKISNYSSLCCRCCITKTSKICKAAVIFSGGIIAMAVDSSMQNWRCVKLRAWLFHLRLRIDPATLS